MCVCVAHSSWLKDKLAADRTLHMDFTVAAAAKLQLNDKLYNLITITCGHLCERGCHNFRARDTLKIAFTS